MVKQLRWKPNFLPFLCPGDEDLPLKFVELGVTTHLLAIERVELQQQAADLVVLLLQNGMNKLYSSIQAYVDKAIKPSSVCPKKIWRLAACKNYFYGSECLFFFSSTTTIPSKKAICSYLMQAFPLHFFFWLHTIKYDWELYTSQIDLTTHVHLYICLAVWSLYKAFTFTRP